MHLTNSKAPWLGHLSEQERKGCWKMRPRVNGAQRSTLAEIAGT